MPLSQRWIDSGPFGAGAAGLGVSGAHAAALFGTAAACFSAGAAVVGFVLGALLAAGLADVSAQGADRLYVFTATSHGRRGQLADCGAIHVERNAPRHHLDVLLLQARRGTVVAGDSALVAGLDARGMLLVGHSGLLQSARAIPPERPAMPSPAHFDVFHAKANAPTSASESHAALMGA
jgi:hypothetical protein